MTARHTALQACDNALASPSIFTLPSTFDFPSGKDMLSKLQTVCRKLQDVHRCRVIECIEETLDTVYPKLGETDSKKLERITQASKEWRAPYVGSACNGSNNRLEARPFSFIEYLEYC